jgi:Holliday junction DNA helicase RuvB
MILTDKNIIAILEEYNRQGQEEIDNGEWFFEEKQVNKPTEVIIKPDALDTSALQAGEGVKSSYRPQTFDEYIGQDKAKKRVECYIKGSKKFNEIFPHTFLSAPAGHGKTVFANILANLLRKKMVVCTGGDLKNEQALVDKIVECNGGILFIDEGHRISQKVGTFALPILEEFLIAGKKIKPFTCIMATTHKGNMAQHLEALLQRFQLDIELEHYNKEDLIQIFQQYHKKMYPDVNIPDDIFNVIGDNCRYTPRIGQTFLKEYVYVEDWNIVKSNNKIVKDGLNETDIKVLQYLVNHKGGGKNTLAKYLKIEPKTYEFEVENYLIFKEFITVGSRRQITEKGKDFLKAL